MIPRSWIVVLLILIFGAILYEFRYEPSPAEVQWEQQRRKRDEEQSVRQKADIKRGWSEWAERVINGPNHYPTPAPINQTQTKEN